MKFNITVLFIFFTLFSCKVEDSSERTIETGISNELAKYRKQQISDVVYNLHFKIPEEKNKPIESKLKLTFYLNNYALFILLTNRSVY